MPTDLSPSKTLPLVAPLPCDKYGIGTTAVRDTSSMALRQILFTQKRYQGRKGETHVRIVVAEAAKQLTGTGQDRRARQAAGAEQEQSGKGREKTFTSAALETAKKASARAMCACVCCVCHHPGHSAPALPICAAGGVSGAQLAACALPKMKRGTDRRGQRDDSWRLETLSLSLSRISRRRRRGFCSRISLQKRLARLGTVGDQRVGKTLSPPPSRPSAL